ncbi:3-hydroxybutyryl-CoA dehydratase [Aliidongia dinghuensis]|uniref:3-hydroxybutyryl-CoA dehydratase n=1 Tax=Aliidongia dinghuensis TaxID=1867774 RepID=A0A8J3E1L5_9PROT|nr:enoyl-CoA hydratase/isomerase family protein [Aliidongia dinghuensis]GGF13054.1 3-hydroxybutyryl-CoA dehydratase [Aliidongia dinghuensis]
MSAIAPSPPVLTRDGARATIRLNRPALHNRLEPADLAMLMAMLDELALSPDLRVLVLTGTGPSFCSGFDLNALGPNESNGGAKSVGFDEVVDRLEDFPRPTVAALQGSVYGGATDLALACDFRIGVEGMKLVMPAGRLGIHYYPSGLERAVARLGLAAAKRLFLLAEPVPAADLLAIGYLDRLVPTDRLAAETDAIAGILAGNAPEAIRGMKRTLNAIARGTLDRAAAQADYEASKHSAELAEGLKAFAEKRKPVF